jgi:hypothetical protein
LNHSNWSLNLSFNSQFAMKCPALLLQEDRAVVQTT